MKKILLGATSSAAVLGLVFGASALANPYDPYVGRTYAQVQQQTSGRAKIASRVGEYLPTDECIVTGSRRLGFLDSSGRGNNTLLVDLNCNDPKSAGGDGSDHAGNSVASPQGRKMADLKERAAALSQNYAKATAAGKESACERNPDGCRSICEKTGACSAELAEFLGL